MQRYQTIIDLSVRVHVGNPLPERGLGSFFARIEICKICLTKPSSNLWCAWL